MSTARLALFVGVPVGDELRALLRHLARWSRLVDGVHPEDGGGVPTAQLWFRDRMTPDPDVPTLAWVQEPADLAAAVAAAEVVASPSTTLATAAGARGVLWPATELEHTVRPVLPVVRRRLRVARGLPERLVVRVDASGTRALGGEALPAELTDTALAVASAVIAVDPPSLLRALAWAAPTVTDAAAAEAVGAEPGRHVLLGDAAEADVLAGDETRASALAWAGRLLVEQRHDRASAARAIAGRLGIPRAPWRTAGALRDRIEELATPPDAALRHRVGTLVGLASASCP